LLKKVSASNPERYQIIRRSFRVLKLANGAVITQGTLQSIGEDASSGDFVYRIDLSAVPEGGPY
jgi:hypothetical protein